MYKGSTTTVRTLSSIVFSIHHYSYKQPTVLAIVLSLGVVLVAILTNMTSMDVTSQAKANDHVEYLTHWLSAVNPSLIATSWKQQMTATPHQQPSTSSVVPSWYQEHHKQNYDWDRSTEDNYKSDDLNFYGTFRSIRQRLDHLYHKNYSPARQAIQDTILEGLLDSTTNGKDTEVKQDCSRSDAPWIIFTAGVYGAGKTHTIKKLYERGQFPLESFVWVDPDEIRRRLPEFPVYVERTPDRAGELTRKEAGMMSELLTNYALDSGLNCLVDGSLKDADWYEKYFNKLRKIYPTLRIGIIHVTAPTEAIFERVKQRGKSTGRVVPLDTLKRSIEEVPKAVTQLRRSVDFFVEIHNPPDESSFGPATTFFKRQLEITFRKKCAAA